MKPFYTSISIDSNNLYYRGVDSKGERVKTPAPFKPSLYFETRDTDTKYKSLEGKSLERKEYNDLASAQKDLYKYRDVSGHTTYGQTNYTNQFIQEKFDSVKDIEFDISKISIANIDIETECEVGFPNIAKAEQEITCLTLYESIHDVYWIYSNQKWGEKNPTYMEKYEGCTICMLDFPNESEMLAAFLRKWSKELDFPDVITGWNTSGFDIPYLTHRLYNLFEKKYVDDRLSPWGIVTRKESQGMYGRTQVTYIWMGIHSLDYMELYKKFNMEKQESYALSHISYVELGEAKLSYEQYDSMHLFYLEDYPRFLEYNLKDVWLINRLEDKLKLMEFAITLAYMARVNYGDIFSPVRLIESLCYTELINNNIIMESKTYGESSRSGYLGAYVKEPQKGLHDWVVSFDLNSLYPSIIRQLNLSPETLVPELENKSVSIESMLNKRVDLSYAKNHNVSVAANGHHFSRDKAGFLPEIIEKLVTGRRAIKNEMLAAEQKLEFVEKEIAERGL